jgi:hypothetical protein
MTSSIWYAARQAELQQWSPFLDVQTQVESHGASIGEVVDISCGFVTPWQLHILARVYQTSKVWYSFGFPIGYAPYAFWPTGFVDLEQQSPGVGPYANPANFIASASCAGTPADTLHVMVTDYLTEKIWHTGRYSIGQWSGDYVDVSAQTQADLPFGERRVRHNALRAACALNVQTYDLHVLMIDTYGNLLHTIRPHGGAGENWTFPFGVVQAQTSVHGQNIGAIAQTACSCNANGDLHVIAIDSATSRLWHTIRLANGSWPYPLGQVTLPVGAITTASCSTDSQGHLHVVAFDNSSSKLWRTMRDASGGWPVLEDVFAHSGAIPNLGSGRAVRSISCTTDPADNLHVFAADAFIL